MWPNVSSACGSGYVSIIGVTSASALNPADPCRPPYTCKPKTAHWATAMPAPNRLREDIFVKVV
jgi:hypothetical protein